VRLEPRSTLGAPFGSVSAVPGFPGRGAILRERADIGCLLLNAAVDATGIIALASKAVGIDLPPVAGAVRTSEGLLGVWLSPRSWLVHCSIEDETALTARVNTAFPDKLVHAARFTDYLCWFDLSGPSSDDLLKEGGFVSLEQAGLAAGHAKRTLIAGITAIVVHEGESVWLIGVERSRARYFADWLAASARRVA
jgi:heterotetrameric sarcosine oxidase gamma subunit